MPHALVELGACAGFSQGYRRGLCGEEQEKETMQQQSTRNKVSTGLFFSLLSTLRKIVYFQFPLTTKLCVLIFKKNLTYHNIWHMQLISSSTTHLVSGCHWVLLWVSVAEITEAASNRLWHQVSFPPRSLPGLGPCIRCRAPEPSATQR